MIIKKLKNIAFYTWFLLFIVLFLQCSTTGQNREEQKVFLWRIENRGSLVFIFGSIHSAKMPLYPFDKRIEDAYDKSDYIAFEINTNQSSISEINHYDMKYGVYPNPVRLKDKIPGGLYSRLGRELRKYGYSVSQVDAIKPWLIVELLQRIRRKPSKYSPYYGVEYYFFTRATGRKKILELENREKHASVFSEMSSEVQIMMLEKTLEDKGNEDELMDKLVEYWKKGDVKSFSKVSENLFPKEEKYKSYYEKLLTERNYIMAEKIGKYLQDPKTYFVVVGAAHLVGRENVLDILRRKGYRPVQM